jgi:hypothetical protein
MTEAEQLERETEETRGQIANILSELRGRMTPGHALDQLVDRFGEAGGPALFSNLKRQTIDNPVPVALVGAGLAWLLFGGGRNGTRPYPSRTARGLGQDAQRTGAQWTEVAGDKVNQARAAMGDKAEQWSDAASRTMGETRTAAGAGETLRHTAESARDSASAGYDAISRFWRDQPVFLAGLGLAIGAAIGAMASATETQDRLMGDAGDKLRDDAGDLIQRQVEAAKKVGRSAAEAARDEAEHLARQDQNLSPASEGADAAEEIPVANTLKGTAGPAEGAANQGADWKEGAVKEDK